jgi:hypothetical protein
VGIQADAAYPNFQNALGGIVKKLSLVDEALETGPVEPKSLPMFGVDVISRI